MRRLALLFLLFLPACKLEAPEETFAALAAWLEVEGVVHHAARSRCVASAAVLSGPETSDVVIPVTSAEEAVNVISRGALLVLQVTGRTPNELSQALTTLDMARGIGLIEPFTGATSCMTDEVVALTDRLVHTPGALMIYDAQSHAVALADTDIMRAVYLRVKH
jgi:hypothetical protein